MRRAPKEEIRGKVDAALDLVQLRAHAEKLPGQLSGGQQQRVAIARAIVIEPPLVLMDEPLSNLDAKLRLEMRTEIKRIHRELGRSTVYVTHDQDEALSLADRIVVLHEGKTQQIGNPEELYAQPGQPRGRALHGLPQHPRPRRRAGRRKARRAARRRDRARRDRAAGDRAGAGNGGDPPRRCRAGRRRRRTRSRPASRSSNIAAATGWSTSSYPTAGLIYARSPGKWRPATSVRCAVAPERVLVFPRESGR